MISSTQTTFTSPYFSKSIEICSEEVREPLTVCAEAIIATLHSVLENTPPELVGDIYQNGICLTGGGALLYGLDTLISEHTGIKAYIANDAVLCVANGTGKSLANLDKLEVLERRRRSTRQPPRAF